MRYLLQTFMWCCIVTPVRLVTVNVALFWEWLSCHFILTLQKRFVTKIWLWQIVKSILPERFQVFLIRFYKEIIKTLQRKKCNVKIVIKTRNQEWCSFILELWNLKLYCYCGDKIPKKYGLRSKHLFQRKQQHGGWKNLRATIKIYKKYFRVIHKQPPEVFYKQVFLKVSWKFMGEYLCQSLLF